MTSAKTAAAKKRPAAKSAAVNGRAAAKAVTKVVTKPAAKSQTQKPSSMEAKSAQRASSSPKELLQAGLSALSLPRAESAMADGLSKIADSFGFKKLEDVFDHRVASALERIGIPSAQELTRLIERVEALSELVQPKKTKARNKALK